MQAKIWCRQSDQAAVRRPRRLEIMVDSQNLRELGDGESEFGVKEYRRSRVRDAGLAPTVLFEVEEVDELCS